jgi:hypothetical protein
MVSKLLDLCVFAPSSGAAVILKPNEDSASPAVGPYYFRVYASQGDPGRASIADGVTLDTAGKYRILVWDAEPDPIPEIDFNAPTWISDRVMVVPEGGIAVGSADPDPWPPT